MDVLNDNDLDNNNNVIDQNQANLDNIPHVNDDENMNDIMENDVFMNRSNENEQNDIEVLNSVDENTENCDSEDETVDRIENKSTSKDLEKQGNNFVSKVTESQNISSNQISLNKRSQKKRKRHYNVNKNKKWGKSFKRQKSNNVVKLETENVSQNNRNKHLYTKVPKITFNNKQVMHRGGGLSKFFLPDKRPRKDIIVPPTKFLLGGNISDPLNLNSLQDEALVSMSAVTPKSSPITTPPKVEVIIPPNIYDPLHLLDPVDSIEYEKQLVSPDKNRRANKQRGKKKKIRKNNTDTSNSMKKNETQDQLHTMTHLNSSPTSVDMSREFLETFGNHDNEIPGNSNFTEEKFKLNRDIQLDLNAGNASSRKRKNSESGICIMNNPCIGSGNVIKKIRRFDSKNKIVSPVIPQPGAWKRLPKVLLGAPRNRIRTSSTSDADNSEEIHVRKNSSSPSDDLKTDNSRVNFQNKECSPERLVPRYTSESTPSFNNASINPSTIQESTKYQFGNYAAQYNGLKTLFNFSDVRLTVFMRHAYLFKDKDILDIGCNVGHMTIAVARNLQPKSIVGIDIDKDLIARARRNLSFFQRIPQNNSQNLCLKTKIGENSKSLSSSSERDKQMNKTKIYSRAKDRDKHEQNQTDYFPLTFSICFGSLPNIKHKIESPSSSPASGTQKQDLSGSVDLCGRIPSASATSSTTNESNGPEQLFPNNVCFRTLDYAVTDESQMVQDKQQYDLILCLSLTKWIHLNFGDSCLKMTFRRMFNQLRPGGKLILEAQNWASYKKRKKLTPNICNNYNSIEFFPDNFHEYLLSPEVGFSHSYTLGIPRHAKKGFYRPIQLYVKGDFTPSQVRWSDTYHPQTPYEPMVRYAHYVDPVKISMPFGRWNYNKMSNLYKRYGTTRYNIPSGISSSTSRYYNPLETDSYLPSYDNVVQTRHYCFASPLYSTIWSPPANGRKSASQTPLFGSIRRVDADDQDILSKHVYLTPRALEGGASSHSIDESTNVSPQTHHVYAIGSSRSVRETDSDTNTNSPKQHVYAFQ